MKFALKVVAVALLVCVVAPAVFYMGLKIWTTWHDEWSGYNAQSYLSDGYCNIAVFPVLGEIHSYGTMYDNQGNEMVSTNMSDANEFFEKVTWDQNILGVVALVDSPGGTAVAAEMIANSLKNSPVPTAAYIADSGTSAAYLAASGADTIIASPYADVGSIGVTMSYLQYSKQNEEQGIEYVTLSSGKFKDYGSPDKPLTDEERALLQRDLGIWHNVFVNQVAENRALLVDHVAKLADGSSMPASLALEAKLIDGVGDTDDVRLWLAEKLSMPVEEIILCPQR